MSILIYSAVDGFLVGYLWTRLVISARLKEAAENLARASEIQEALHKPPPPPGPVAPPPGASPIPAPAANTAPPPSG